MIDEQQLIFDISSKLELFKKRKTDLFNFRCNICGDSQKSKIKTRGYFYKKDDHFQFKCFNCSYSASLTYYAKEFFPDIYSRYCFNSFEQTFNTIKKIKKEEVNNIVSEDFPELIHYSKSALAKDYLNSRKIPLNKCSSLLYIEDLNDLIIKFLDKDYKLLPYKSSRIVFPVRSKDNILIGFVCRALDKDDQIRYYNIKVNEHIPLLYGQQYIDNKKPVYILEGIIDSLFLNNSLAACSSGFQNAILYCKKNNLDYTLVLDNEKNNTEIRKLIERYINKGEKLVIFSNFPYKGKDINEMILKNSRINIQEELHKRTYSGLLAKLEFYQWQQQ